MTDLRKSARILVCILTVLVGSCTRDTGPSTFDGRAVTASFVDSVPAYRKGGLLWKYGVEHQPVGLKPLTQDAARLIPYQDTAVFMWSPEEPLSEKTNYIVIELNNDGADEGTRSTIYPFVFSETSMVVFSDGQADPSCANISPIFSNEYPETLASSIGADPEFVALFPKKHACRVLDKVDSLKWAASFPEISEVKAIGLLIVSHEAEPIEVKSLFVGNHHEKMSNEIKVQTSVPDADALASVFVREPTLSAYTLNNQKKSKKQILSRNALNGQPFQIWYDDFGRAIYPANGHWLDPAKTPNRIEVGFRSEFEILEGIRQGISDRHRRKHKLSIWAGSKSKMETQEYEGWSILNNFGRADRDRFKENTDDCFRVAVLGGSYIEAVQTKISEKPGIIAEAISGSTLGRCTDIFTIGANVMRPENHIGNAISLVNDFGVDYVLFSLSATEICQMADVFYEKRYGLSPKTPRHWRIVDDKALAPFDAESRIRRDPDTKNLYSSISTCELKDLDFNPLEREVVGKLPIIAETVQKLTETKVAVEFLLVKDAIAAEKEIVDTITKACLKLSVTCHAVPIPDETRYPAKVERFSPYLYRYKVDYHPNIRANQYIGTALADVVTQHYQMRNGAIQ